MLVTCLCNFLSQHSTQTTDGVDPLQLPRPSQAEADTLRLVNSLVPIDVSKALRAGIVSRWLKNYPLGQDPTQSVKDIMRGIMEDINMDFVGILRVLLSNPEGRRAMRTAGLVGSSMGEVADENCWPGQATDLHDAMNSDRMPYVQNDGQAMRIPDIESINMGEAGNSGFWLGQTIDLHAAINSDGICYIENDRLAALPVSILEYLRLAIIRDRPSTDGIILIDPDNPHAMAMIHQDMELIATGREGVYARRERSQRIVAFFQLRRLRESQRAPNDAEQAAIRRRRREAMVFHEGESPISREDIFQRRMTGDAPVMDTEATSQPWVDMMRQRSQARAERSRRPETALATAQREYEAATRPRDDSELERASHRAAPVRWADIMHATRRRNTGTQGIPSQDHMWQQFLDDPSGEWRGLNAGNQQT